MKFKINPGESLSDYRLRKRLHEEANPPAPPAPLSPQQREEKRQIRAAMKRANADFISGRVDVIGSIEGLIRSIEKIQNG